MRARATCTNADGTTVSGESEYFSVVNNGVAQVPPITFQNVEPIPVSMRFASSQPITLTSAGATSQLAVTALYTDASTQNVTASARGTNYASTNTSVATVSAEGLVTAVGSGFALITARKDGVLAMQRVLVQTGGDSDGDGIPDAYELAHGLDPNDPVDAFEDQDHDGLRALAEYQRGTDLRNPDTDGEGIEDGEEVVAGDDGYVSDPLLVDTDGDQLSDALEVSVGSNPSDASSHNYGAAIVSLSVTPGHLSLVNNTVSAADIGHQLSVTGTLLDGSRIDLTSTARGTNYASSDLSVCNFGLDPGRVYGGQPGTCEVTVRNGAFQQAVTAEVTRFDPVALSRLVIPGAANAVDVAGDYAYVAAGSAGLVVVDVHDRAHPFISATVDTPGNAYDVRVSGELAFVADGEEGVAIASVSDPTHPSLIGSVDTPSVAQDVAYQAGFVYVADGDGGLQIVDATAPASPRLVGNIHGIGQVVGVDVLANLAVVVSASGVHAVNVNLPEAPALMGSLNVANIYDVRLSETYAYLAAYTNGFFVVDLAAPERPVIVAQDNPFYPSDVTVRGNLAFYADILFANGIPYVNIREPDYATYQGFIDLTMFGDPNGTGVAADQQFVYLTGDQAVLMIAQYQQIRDTQGVAPTLSILAPTAGTHYVEGEPIIVSAAAEDDVLVGAVQLWVDGVLVDSDFGAPYELRYTPPAGQFGELNLLVRALDSAGNRTDAPPRAVRIEPDPLTRVTGTVVDFVGQPIPGATLRCGAQFGTAGADGSFSIPGVRTVVPVACVVQADSQGAPLVGGTAGVTPVRGGITNVGMLYARPPTSAFIRVAVTSLDMIEVTNISPQPMNGAFDLYYYTTRSTERAGIQVDSAWHTVSIAPNQTIQLPMPSRYLYYVAEPGVYELEFTGSLGPVRDVTLTYDLRMPALAGFCKYGMGSGRLEARVAGELVGARAIAAGDICSDMLVNAVGAVDVAFIPDTDSFVVSSQTYPRHCDFPTPCTLTFERSYQSWVEFAVGVVPFAALELSTGTRDCASQVPCTGTFTSSPSLVSVVQAQVVCDAQQGGLVRVDEQILAGPVATSISALPFSTPRPAPRGSEYFVKVCEWCSLPERRQLLRVRGLLNGYPVDGESYTPLFEGQCGGLDPDGCSYFQIDPSIYPGGPAIDEFWGSRTNEYCKF